MTNLFPSRRLASSVLVFLLVFFSSFLTVHATTADDWFIAIKNDQSEKVKEMLRNGFNPNTIEKERGDSGLILAMRENAMDVMEVLLADKRTLIDVEAFNGDNALMIACYKANEKAVKVLLDKGAKVNKDGWSPLHYAAASGNNKIVQMLLDWDAFVNAASPNGTTPVMMAARGGHIYTVKLLHDNGADITLKNQRGYSAVDFAMENKNSDIAKGLLYRIKKEEELEKKKNVMPKFPF